MLLPFLLPKYIFTYASLLAQFIQWDINAELATLKLCIEWVVMNMATQEVYMENALQFAHCIN